jgi:hypothetical protein
VANKPRTPSPPRRPVQAPQRRTSDRSDADRRTLRMLVLFAASGFVLLGIVIAAIVLTTRGDSKGTSVAAAMQAAGCTVKTATAASRKHLSSLSTKVKYNTDPPSNGTHYYQPAIWDFYTTAANPKQVLHNEEHGGVIIWWGNKVPQATVDKLHTFYDSSPNAMLGTPYPTLGSKIALTAWEAPAGGMGQGHVAICPTYDEKAFTAFRDAYRGKGPERFPVDTLTPGT